MTMSQWPKTEFCERVRNSIPLIQAPMAGGITTPELVAAVSNTGAIGSLAGSPFEPDELRAEIRQIRHLTRRPFNVNLFVPSPAHQAIPIAYLEKLKEFEREVGFAMTMEIESSPSFEKQAEILLEEEVPIFSFTFGIPPLAILKEFHRKRIVLLGTATHAAEILALQDAGVDFIVCQGKEAGGHRGTFIGSLHEGLVPTMELIQKGKEISKKPLIAAGGLMTGKQIHEALQAGACAAQLGTAFLCCTESGADPSYKKALHQWKSRNTALTKAFSGKWTRCIDNRFVQQMASLEEVPPYPIAQSLTKPLREAAAAAGNSEFLALYAGEGFPHCQSFTAQELIARLTLELPSPHK